MAGDQIDSREWFVEPLSEHADAVEIVEMWHYSKSAANCSVNRHGLYRRDSLQLRGASLWMPPTKVAAQSVAGEGWRGVLSLSRLVVDPEVPTNGASFLLGRSMRLVDRERWPVLLTYADTNHGHTGAIYKATNWECLGEVRGGSVWVDPEGRQRGQKRGPKNIPAAQMREEGYVRMPSAPKIKFVHRARSTGRHHPRPCWNPPMEECVA